MSPPNESQPLSVPVSRERWIGTVFALLATMLYGVSNVAMRCLAEYRIDIDWILFYKELIGVGIIAPWILFRLFQGRLLYISKRLIPVIVLAGIIGQLIGAHLQLLGYAIIGLILAVPLIQSSTLLGVAIFGFWILGDPLSKRRKFAIAVLIVAITTLSIGKELMVEPTNGTQAEISSAEASPQKIQQNVPQEPNVNSGLFLLVALGAVGAGLSFSIYTIMIRYTICRYWKDDDSPWKSFSFRRWAGSDIDKNIAPKNVTARNSPRFYSPFPVTLMMLIVLGTGVIVFGTCLYCRNGTGGFYTVPAMAWYIIPISGISNTVGFFFQIQSLRMTTAVQASLVSIAQIIILSFIGFFCFDESINVLVIFGLVLTFYGVIISAKPEN